MWGRCGRVKGRVKRSRLSSSEAFAERALDRAQESPRQGAGWRAQRLESGAAAR